MRKTLAARHRVYGMSLTLLLFYGSSPLEASRVYRYQIGGGETLSGVATKLYGNSKKAKDIAKWNNLSDVNYVWEGSILRLLEKPLEHKETEPEPAADVDPELDSRFFTKGSRFIKKKKYKLAVKDFRKGRINNPEHLPSWVSEIH